MNAPRPVRLEEAARELGKSPVTLRKWIAQGAPCARPGEPGRGKGALVCVIDLKRWRAKVEGTSREEELAALAGILRDFERRYPDAAGLPPAAILAAAFRYVRTRRVGTPLDDPVPADIQALEELALQCKPPAK